MILLLIVIVYICLTGVSMMIAAGPYTTSDNLEMIPLSDLLSHVTNYKPNILIMESALYIISL